MHICFIIRFLDYFGRPLLFARFSPSIEHTLCTVWRRIWRGLPSVAVIVDACSKPFHIIVNHYNYLSIFNGYPFYIGNNSAERNGQARSRTAACMPGDFTRTNLNLYWCRQKPLFVMFSPSHSHRFHYPLSSQPASPCRTRCSFVMLLLCFVVADIHI